MADKLDVYKHTTDTFVAAIEEAIKGDKKLPWDKPWNVVGGASRNFNSKRAYRGFINQFVLAMAGYSQPYWATYKGWREAAYKEWAKGQKIKIEDADLEALKDKRKTNTDNVKAFYEAGGGGVAKDEKSQIVVFWARYPNKKYDENNPDSGPKMFFMLRYYRVWNIEQTTGITIPGLDEIEREFTPIEAAEKIWDDWTDNRPELKWNGNRAAYNPATDVIEMPERKLFKTDEGFYKTLWHEGIHATGHDSRLKRKLDVNFGSDPYSREELTAEMGAAMLCAHAGIDSMPIKENTEAYLLNWIKALKGDSKLVVGASTKAAAACDLILGVTYENDDKKDES